MNLVYSIHQIHVLPNNMFCCAINITTLYNILLPVELLIMRYWIRLLSSAIYIIVNLLSNGCRMGQSSYAIIIYVYYSLTKNIDIYASYIYINPIIYTHIIHV